MWYVYKDCMKQQIAHITQLELWVVKSSHVRKLDDNNVQQGHPNNPTCLT